MLLAELLGELGVARLRLRLAQPRHARGARATTASELQAYLRAHEDELSTRGARRASTSTRCARSTPTTRARAR